MTARSTGSTAADSVHLSVVIATYNRTDSVRRLLLLLAAQTLPASTYEVIVVDDGSSSPVAPALADLQQTVPYMLQVITQQNGGPGAARNVGVRQARGAVVVIIDDDMRVERDFLEAHAREHPDGTRNAVLGVLRTAPDARLPLFERYQMAMLGRLYENVRSGREAVRGWDLYTGNVSFRREDYLAAGGFDPSLRLSEDAELGIRLEADGVAFRISDAAFAVNASDHTSVDAWMSRALRYGSADARIAEKHPELAAANPWRFLFMISPVSRPVMLAAVIVPWLMRPVAWLAMWTSLALARLGMERAAIAGTTFTYGLQYFRGLRAHWKSATASLAALRAYSAQQSHPESRSVAQHDARERNTRPTRTR